MNDFSKFLLNNFYVTLFSRKTGIHGVSLQHCISLFHTDIFFFEDYISRKGNDMKLHPGLIPLCESELQQFLFIIFYKILPKQFFELFKYLRYILVKNWNKTTGQS